MKLFSEHARNDPQTDFPGPIAASADEKTVVTIDRSGDLVTIVEIPRDGGPARELATLMNRIKGLDVGPNGDLYVDQESRPQEVVLMDADGNRPRVVVTLATLETGGSKSSTMMPDGRILVPIRAGDRNRLLVVKPGDNPAPFVQTDDETSGPVAMVGQSSIAFLLGSARTLTIASVADGRITRRLENAHGAAIESVAAHPNGKTLYYAAAGEIWSVPVTGGQPSMVREGESVAADPRGDALVIQLNENNNVRFVRLPLAGGKEESLTFANVRPATTPMSASAVGPDGTIVKNANYSDSWPWNLALLRPGGKAQRVILPLLDVQTAGWTPSGQIFVFAVRTYSTIWRLRPAPRAGQ